MAFVALHLVSPRSMGFGDVKLAFVLGLVLGWLGWGELVLGLFLGFLYGAVVGIAAHRPAAPRRERTTCPFGPFLAAGTIDRAPLGRRILDWYPG